MLSGPLTTMRTARAGRSAGSDTLESGLHPAIAINVTIANVLDVSVAWPGRTAPIDRLGDVPALPRPSLAKHDCNALDILDECRLSSREFDRPVRRSSSTGAGTSRARQKA